MNDVVYHAGDFGDISTMKDVLSSLNYKQLIWVMGNYDRTEALFIRNIIKETIMNKAVKNRNEIFL